MSFNGGKPYHGSSQVEGGKLTGMTGKTDYFFFLCPKCKDAQILRILEYGVKSEGPVERIGDKGLKANHEFILAFHLHRPECGFDDFAKLGNNHRADKVTRTSVARV